MSLSFLKALVNALEMFAVAMQIKYKSFYFMIEFLNINKLFFYLFVLDFFNSGFIKCVNDFTRSHNHKNLNWIVSYFFNLHDPQNLHEYKTISSSIRSSINENRIEAKEILNPKEVLLFFWFPCFASISFFALRILTRSSTSPQSKDSPRKTWTCKLLQNE